MARTERMQMWRKASQIFFHLDIAMTLLLEFCQMFIEPHPELAQPLETLASVLLTVEQTFEKWSIEVWQKTKEQLEQYRG